MTPLQKMQGSLLCLLLFISIGGILGGRTLYHTHQELEKIHQDCLQQQQQRQTIQETSLALKHHYQQDERLREACTSLEEGGMDRATISARLLDLFSSYQQVQFSFGAAHHEAASFFSQTVRVSFEGADDRMIMETLSAVETLPGVWSVERISLERAGSLLKGELQWRWLSSQQPLLP